MDRLDEIKRLSYESFYMEIPQVKSIKHTDQHPDCSDPSGAHGLSDEQISEFARDSLEAAKAHSRRTGQHPGKDSNAQSN
jgi:hypothetical protein